METSIVPTQSSMVQWSSDTKDIEKRHSGFMSKGVAMKPLLNPQMRFRKFRRTPSKLTFK